MAYRRSLFATLIVLAVLDLFAGVVDSQEPAPVPTPPRTRLVVGLIQSPPFCMRDDDGSWSGLSVELWREIAADLGIDTEFRETTVTGLFDGLAPGRPLDVSIGVLTITPEREDRLDFTQPFYLSGLGVAVKTAPGAGGLWEWLGRVLASDRGPGVAGPDLPLLGQRGLNMQIIPESGADVWGYLGLHYRPRAIGLVSEVVFA